MTPDDFLHALESILQQRRVSFTRADAIAFVESCWELIADEPDPWTWSERFAEAGAVEARPTMLIFTLYTEDDYDRSRHQVRIDPAAVISVEETEHRAANGGYWQVAVITLATGDKHIVEDDSRTASRRIAEAQQTQAEAPA